MVAYTGTLVDDPTFGREDITDTSLEDPESVALDIAMENLSETPSAAPDLGPLGDLAAPSLPSDITIGRPATAEEQLEAAAKDYLSDPLGLPGLISLLGDAFPGVLPGSLLAVVNPAAMLLAAGKGLKGLYDFFFAPENTGTIEWSRDDRPDLGPLGDLISGLPENKPPGLRYEDLFPFVPDPTTTGPPGSPVGPPGTDLGPLGDLIGGFPPSFAYPPGTSPFRSAGFDTWAGPGWGPPFSPFESGLAPGETGSYEVDGSTVGYEGFSSPEAAESYGSYDGPGGWGPAFQEGGLASLSRNRGSSLRPGQESGILRTSFQEGGPAYTGTKVDAMDEMSDEKREELNLEREELNLAIDDEIRTALAIDDATRTAVEEFGIIEGKRLGEGTPYYYGPSSRDMEKGLDYSKQALRDMEWTQAEIDKLGEMSSRDRFKFDLALNDFLHKQAYLPQELREGYPRGNTRKDLDDFERMLEGPPKLPSHMVPRKSLTAAAKRTFAEGMADMVEAFRTPGGLGDKTGIGAGEFFTDPSGGFWSRLSSAFTDTTGPGTFWGGAGPAYGVVDDGRGGTRAPVGPDDAGGILDNGQVWDSGSASGPPGGDPGGYAAMGADWGSPFQEGGLASLYPKPNRGSSLRPGQESGILRQ